MTEMPDNRLRLPEGRPADAAADNWVDRHAPPWTRPYLRLSRADRPIGTWLLLIPCWWAIALGAIETGWSLGDLWLIAGSGIGAVLMRGAGCSWNDLVDREIDKGVARTRARPLAAGDLAPRQAFLWAVLQSLAAFLILLTFNNVAIVLGILSLLPVAVYPYAKRFTWWPQVFLGIAFNWGALLLYAAQTGYVGLPSLFLYLAGIAWTLHYDTIYAHQDREDDALIGVKSTARLFERETAGWLAIFAAAVAVIGLLAVLTAGGGLLAVIGLAGLVGQMAAQIRQFDMDDPDTCLALFRQTRWGGLAFAGGLFLDSLI